MARLERSLASRHRDVERPIAPLRRLQGSLAHPPPIDAQVNRARGARALEGREIPLWFGTLKKYARRIERHDMGAIRESIARGISAERAL